jgi:integrase
LAFPGKNRDTPIIGASVDHAVRRWLNPEESRERALIIEHWTPHDLRAWVATKLAELRFSRPIVDKLLNHVDSSMGGVYDRYDYAKEKRDAVEAIERELQSIRAGNVVPMHGRRRA